MRVAVITGAASGIGLALSLVCLQKGITVVMTDKDGSKLNDEANRLMVKFPDQVLHVRCDITNPDEVNQLVQLTAKKLGRVDWIYNNAGIIGSLAPVWELKPEQINRVMDVNLYGMIHVIQAFIPLLFKQSFNSHIINIASLYALCSGSQMASYAMSKHAVLALTESLYFDLQRLEKPVQVSIAFPSFTDTALLSNQSVEKNSPFHDSLNSLMSHSRPAMEVAQHIVQEVEQQRFYIMPDKEVKGYCEERTQSIVLQDKPHLNNIEKLIGSLLKRKNP
ncbi:SDR family NAD(P)-dependent oxidoreductase [Legionella maioricensis]|uniref:SDR family NAD(P)-dependent oxidoreductase n=1 Tax=Legionella maioricensis TaxID=2896528 RepID=A0A9X2IBK3_9GAMM|nr:SDR family NAD(P)-dependent oxidoreductase [Legionella maioricensis]MCL9683482.1 SDR family NAD(P)-dependent oxidoreductase [Legionella maioricensis]MCL9686781.1 SDR family NAD(P)-dependent oxidoreductase [Legionella maioricensis]